ncbi:hypothetical protein FIBSPDRAFT_551904 [Athelia psychrophila]|uniref:Uncharacterized protein n=1 Tax=Athelia psychrophila TaxID=1759441 RepID=A0A166UVH7_9AGAM|nr:hypothetical protein FIBSPDRAFT_551904 [Fibularhizoctonia sp. CBS 109695]
MILELRAEYAEQRVLMREEPARGGGLPCEGGGCAGERRSRGPQARAGPIRWVVRSGPILLLLAFVSVCAPPSCAAAPSCTSLICFPWCRRDCTSRQRARLPAPTRLHTNPTTPHPLLLRHHLKNIRNTPPASARRRSPAGCTRWHQPCAYCAMVGAEHRNLLGVN